MKMNSDFGKKIFKNLPEPIQNIPIEGNVDVVKCMIENLTGKSADVVLHEFTAGNVRALGFMFDGMSDQLLVAKTIMNPLIELADNISVSAQDLPEYVKKKVVTETDIKDVSTLNKAIEDAMGGFFVVFFDECSTALSFSVQGFERRSVDEPVSEAQERGGREGFTESFKVNMTLMRRRLRSPDMRFKLRTVGASGNNSICLCYMEGRASEKLLSEVERRLDSANFDIVLSTGYLQPFLDTHYLSIFSGVGVTERPDVACAKICEGKIVIILDGTPFAIYVPHIFVENIHAFDDYANRPFYTTFMRMLKLVSFIISIALPGIYVALTIFHQELFPEDMLFNIVSSEMRTPFPIMLEALIIHLIFEIMREAGLRMPKTIGHAVSIVGALVIGDAAVTAGLMAAPMLIIVALTAISSYVMPTLYNSVAVLRLVFIVLGGILGLYGVILGLIVLAVNMTAINPYGVPYTSPFAPIVLPAFRDMIYRQGWKKMSKKIQVNRTLETEEL